MMSYALAGSALVLLLAFVRRRADKYEDVCVAAFIPISIIVLAPIARIESLLRPLTWDARLRAVDIFFGADDLAFARFCLARHWLDLILASVYLSLPFMFSLIWALERSKQFFRAGVIGALGALPFYLAVPAAGPIYAFPGWPEHALASSGLLVVSTAWPRNCFPSMHCAWAMLLALNSQNRLLRAFFVIYAVLTAFAIVAVGEHYFIDAIAAVPFTFAVQWTAEHWPAWIAQWRGRILEGSITR